jgi:hypothetical protein
LAYLPFYFSPIILFDVIDPQPKVPTLEPTTGPLVGVIDPLTTRTYCLNGALDPTTAARVDTVTGKTFANSPNSVIVNDSADQPSPNQFTREQSYQDSTKALGNPGVVPKAGWREWFAQAFAIQANNPYTNSNFQTVNPVIAGSSNEVLLDSMVTVGYFSCTGNQVNGWLHYVYVQTPLATCTAAPPAGYVTRHAPVHNSLTSGRN